MKNLVVKFSDGEQVTLKNWDNWSKDYDGKKDIIDLFSYYKSINKELTFNNPSTGFETKRYAEDVSSIEIIFE